METVLPNLNPIWLSHHLHTYLLLQPGVSAETVEAKLSTLIDQYVAHEFESIVGTTYEEARAGGLEFGYYMQPLTGLYLQHVGSDAIGATSDIRYIYVLGAIGPIYFAVGLHQFYEPLNGAFCQQGSRSGAPEGSWLRPVGN